MQIVALLLFCVACTGFGWRTRPRAREVQTDPLRSELRSPFVDTPQDAFVSFSPMHSRASISTDMRARGLSTSGFGVGPSATIAQRSKERTIVYPPALRPEREAAERELRPEMEMHADAAVQSWIRKALARAKMREERSKGQVRTPANLERVAPKMNTEERRWAADATANAKEQRIITERTPKEKLARKLPPGLRLLASRRSTRTRRVKQVFTRSEAPADAKPSYDTAKETDAVQSVLEQAQQAAEKKAEEAKVASEAKLAAAKAMGAQTSAEQLVAFKDKQWQAAEAKVAAAENLMLDMKAEQAKLSMEVKALEEAKARRAKQKGEAEAHLAAKQEAVQEAQKIAEEKLAIAEGIMSEIKAKHTKISSVAPGLEEVQTIDTRAKAAEEWLQNAKTKVKVAEVKTGNDATAMLKSKASAFLKTYFPKIPSNIFAEHVQMQLRGAEDQTSDSKFASSLQGLLAEWARNEEVHAVSFEKIAGPMKRVDAQPCWYFQVLCRISLRGKNGVREIEAPIVLRLNDDWQIFSVNVQRYMVNDHQLSTLEDFEALH